MPLHDIISSFNAGELSPYVESRTNLDKYRSGCKRLENYLITPYGPINRRPGTQFLGTAKTSSSRSRLFGLNLSDSSKIVMELGVGYVRFWQNGALQTYGSVQTWNGVAYAIGQPIEAVGIADTSSITAPVFSDASGTVGSPHPYQAADLRNVTICQVNNVVYLTHPNYPPMRLSYWGDNPINPPWTLGPVAWKWAPMLDQNYTSNTITPSATTGSIALTASSALWSPQHVGAFWEISHPNPNGICNLYLTPSLTGVALTSPNIQVQGDWALQTFGIWYGTLYLDQSTDGGSTWTTLRSYYSNGDYNATSNGTAEGVLGGYQVLPFYRLRFVAGTGSPTNSPRALFQPINPTLSGYLKITNYISPTQVIANVLAPMISTQATSLWREGAFSEVQGYPAVVSLHESRIIFAGTTLAPTKVWGSYTGDFENFKQGANAADSYSFALASQSGGRVEWMLSKGALLLGTTCDEWYISGGTSGGPIAPGSVSAQKQSHYGSSSLPAIIVNDTALYVQRMGRKIREFVYTWQSQTWISNDLTALAQHVTQAGIVELAYQRVPDAILWVLRTDGTLVAMTYEREQQVTGFARMLTNPANGDVFESVATINSASGEDEIWLLVRRTINGEVVRYVERFCPGQRDALDQQQTESYWYLDCAKAFTFSEPTSSITGLDHLEGQAVLVWAGSALAPLAVTSQTVQGGTINLQSPVTSALVGLPFTSLVVPEQFQRDLQDGTSAGRRMRIPKLNIKLYNSQAGEYSSDGKTWYPLRTRSVGEPMDTPLVPYFGYERVSLASNWKDGVDFYLRQTLPMPLTIAAVVGTWETSEVEQ